MLTYPFLDSAAPIAFAHRGGATPGDTRDGVATDATATGPTTTDLENTLAAFTRAWDLGYRYFETDVHATADRVAVAFHDLNLARMTGVERAVRNVSWGELSQVRVGGREPIPRLDDLLDAFPDSRVNLDVKHESAIAPMVEAIRRTGSIDRVCVGSFSNRRLALVRRALGPRLATSFGPRSVAGLLAACRVPSPETLLRRLMPAGVPCVQVPPALGRLPVVTRRFVDLAHALGLAVHVWTVNDRAEMERLLDLGVDGLMTDELERLRDVLVPRGAWPQH